MIMNPTNSKPIDATSELEIGQVQWHCSEEGGGPDVGILLRLDDKNLLWWGELLADESSGSFGAVIYGPDGERQVFDAAYDEIRQVFEDYVAPALRTRKSEALADGAVERAAELRDVVMPVIGACLLMRSDDPKLAHPRLGVAAEVANAVAKHLSNLTPSPAVDLLREARDIIERGRRVNELTSPQARLFLESDADALLARIDAAIKEAK